MAIRYFLARVKHDYPQLKMIILLDGLYADNPTIVLIRVKLSIIPLSINSEIQLIDFAIQTM